jgi:gamma-glutamyl:cysteine ligase YbdK (ATP-grasp superfamily)
LALGKVFFLLWRAIRWGLAGDLIELRSGRVRAARAALEELVEWVSPIAGDIGAATYLTAQPANAAERQIARRSAGAPLEEIYAAEARPRDVESSSAETLTVE